MTRDEIYNLQVGDKVQRSLLGEEHFEETTIKLIFARGISSKGQAYACVYTQFGENAEMSGTIDEGDDRFFKLGEKS